MESERALKAILESDAGVTALVGAGASARIYAVRAAQDAAMPFIVYAKAGAEREINVGAPSQIVQSLLSVRCVAGNYADLKALARAVRLALVGKNGVFAGTVVHSLHVESEGPDEDDVEFERLSQEWTYRMVHEE